MKKALAIFGVVTLAVIIVFFASYFILTTPDDEGEFSISDYSEKIENADFQTAKTYDRITDYKSAAKVGKTAISERFPNSEGGIFEWMGCDVWYDNENDAYYIRTYYISLVPMFGGGYDVILKSDGTVLAIWGEK